MNTNDDQKLQDLQAQIDALKEKTEPRPEKPTAQAENMSLGMRAGTELIGAIGGSALIGYGLDRWLGTAPWIMIVLLILGVGAGFMNVWKVTQGMGSSVGFKKPDQKGRNQPF
jgi:ATP synthase protein I